MLFYSILLLFCNPNQPFYHSTEISISMLGGILFPGIGIRSMSSTVVETFIFVNLIVLKL
jgi:hypothetical protein